MASKYTKDEIKNKLNRSAYHLVATSGIESMTTRKISSGCGLSDPYIYQCYSDLSELATEAYLGVDRSISGLLASLLKKSLRINNGEESGTEEQMWFLWSNLWKFCMEDSEKIIFCYRFCASGYYSKEIHKIRLENYELFTKFIQHEIRKMGFEKSFNVESVVVGIVDYTIATAAKIHLGYIDVDELSPRVIYASAFSYICRVLSVELGD